MTTQELPKSKEEWKLNSHIETVMDTEIIPHTLYNIQGNPVAADYIVANWNRIKEIGMTNWQALCSNPSKQVMQLIEEHIFLKPAKKSDDNSPGGDKTKSIRKPREFNPSIHWPSIFANPSAAQFITDNWQTLTQPSIVALLGPTAYHHFCRNTSPIAIKLMRKHMVWLILNNKVDWSELCANSSAFPLIQEYWDYMIAKGHHDWARLFENENALPLIDRHWGTAMLDRSKIDWERVRWGRVSYGFLDTYHKWLFDNDKINWPELFIGWSDNQQADNQPTAAQLTQIALFITKHADVAFQQWTKCIEHISSIALPELLTSGGSSPIKDRQQRLKQLYCISTVQKYIIVCKALRVGFTATDPTAAEITKHDFIDYYRTIIHFDTPSDMALIAINVASTLSSRLKYSVLDNHFNLRCLTTQQPFVGDSTDVNITPQTLPTNSSKNINILLYTLYDSRLLFKCSNHDIERATNRKYFRRFVCNEITDTYWRLCDPKRARPFYIDLELFA